MAQFIQNSNRDAKTREQEAFDRELKAATESILGEINNHTNVRHNIYIFNFFIQIVTTKYLEFAIQIKVKLVGLSLITLIKSVDQFAYRGWLSRSISIELLDLDDVLKYRMKSMSNFEFCTKF